MLPYWFTNKYTGFGALHFINLYPTIVFERQLQTEYNGVTLQKSLKLRIKDFNCVFVRTEINLIAFLCPGNSVNTQYAALSGAMGYATKG